MMSQRTMVLFWLMAAVGCSSNKGSTTTVVPAYLAGDQCHQLASETLCVAQSGCEWIAVTVATGSSNGSGGSTPVTSGWWGGADPCAKYSDPMIPSPTAAMNAAWAKVAGPVRRDQSEMPTGSGGGGGGKKKKKCTGAC